jgi:predicted Zn finger-like uncharacterized protein
VAKEKVVVKSSGHGAAYRKIRCPHCKTGYAVGDARTGFTCGQCGRKFTQTTLR